MRPPLLFATLALAAAACAADTDERPADFAYISKTILEPNCATATCHNDATAREGYDFSSVEASRETFRRNGLVVQPDDPPANPIIYILTTSGEERMPIDGPLPDADIALIERWIINGAELE
jgi:hypothetical protein